MHMVKQRFIVAVYFCHVLTALYWLTSQLYLRTTNLIETTCWPGFASCLDLKFSSPYSALILMGSYGSLSLAALFFDNGKKAFGSTLWLSLLLLLQVFIASLDYKFRGNHVYLFVVFQLLVLAWPRLVQVFPLFMALLYFWAGTLKFNHDWLSGAALYHDLPLIPQAFVASACRYVLALELIGPFFLYFAKGPWFYAFWLQFLVFHFMSWSVVGFYYPSLMIVFLFLLLWLKARTPRLSFFSQGIKPSAWAFVFLFCFLQFIPRAIPGPEALTGEGRLLSLYMFDAFGTCDAQFGFTDKRGEFISISLFEPNDAVRVGCDPINLLARARYYCHILSEQMSEPSFKFGMLARYKTDTKFSVRGIANFNCQDPSFFKPFARNEWLRY